MKVVTIGRELNNDIVINDGKVSRHHIQIVSDGGTYRIVDFNSSNGTFVNGQRITGEMPLTPTDVVRIGNTTLSWQTYFSNDKNSGGVSNSTILWTVGSVAVLAIVACLVYFLYIQNDNISETNPSGTVVKIYEQNGERYLPITVNGQQFDFKLVKGNSISVPISWLWEDSPITIDDISLSNLWSVIGAIAIQDYAALLEMDFNVNLKTLQLSEQNSLYTENVEAVFSFSDYSIGEALLSRFGKCTIMENEIIFK
jgi:pSer/pThr/pTyr-binding forkhead associated (FHA) protein